MNPYPESVDVREVFTPISLLRRVVERIEGVAPEAIPFPFTRLYNLIVCRLPIREVYVYVAEEAERWAGGRTIRVLDVGTGPGHLPIEIARRLKNAEVVGIDLSVDMIHIARENALKAGVQDRVKFLVQNASSLEFPERRFDLVVSTGSLHHWKKAVGALNEIYRVLERGGEAWIYDLNAEPSMEEIREFESKYGKLLSVLVNGIVLAHSSITLNDIELLAKKSRFTKYALEKPLPLWLELKLYKI